METSDSSLKESLNLFRLCFPKSKIFTFSYLQWLYRDNPAGKVLAYNAYSSDNTLAAHYATVPARWSYGNKEVRGLLSLNTATHPAHQRKGLFTQLAEKTYQSAKDQDFTFVLGVANQNSFPGFVHKLGFKHLGALDVRLSLGLPSLYYHQTKLNPIWREDSISWRSKRPGSSYLTLKTTDPTTNVLAASSSYPLLKVLLGTLPQAQPHSQNSWSPFIWAGVGETTTFKNLLSFSLPNFLKPSPLHLIYKPLDPSFEEVTRQDIKLEFIDFDAF